jgi:hypothetical protein
VVVSPAVTVSPAATSHPWLGCDGLALWGLRSQDLQAQQVKKQGWRLSNRETHGEAGTVAVCGCHPRPMGLHVPRASGFQKQPQMDKKVFGISWMSHGGVGA